MPSIAVLSKTPWINFVIPCPGNGKRMLEAVEAESEGGYEFHEFRESAKAIPLSTPEGNLLLA